MINENRCTLFLQADEIDHLTIRYTDFGEKLNTRRGIEMILFYSSAYEEVKNALPCAGISEKHLSSLSEDEIYKLLVKVRTVLLDEAFSK